NQFPKWSGDDWLTFARQTFKEVGGRIVPDYDPKLATILEAIGPAQPLPALWKEFDALGRVPVVVIRGANSDLLSQATVEAMRKRRHALEVVEVPDEGHAPRLVGSRTIGRVAALSHPATRRARGIETRSSAATVARHLTAESLCQLPGILHFLARA